MAINKTKMSTQSLQSINMSKIEYMMLHRRLAAYTFKGEPVIALRQTYSSEVVFIPVTKSTFDSFERYELDFGSMLNLFSALCIKYGNVPF